MRPFLARLGAALAPCPLVLVAALAGATAESLFLATAREDVYAFGGPIPILVPPFLAAVWLAAGWLLWGVARRCVSRTESWRPAARRTVRWAGVAFLLLGVFAYLASWGFYLKTGRFCTLDAVDFVFSGHRNLHMLWRYAVEAEPWILAAFAGVGAAAGAGVPLFLRAALRSSWASGAPRRPAIRAVIPALAAFVLWVVLCGASIDLATLHQLLGPSTAFLDSAWEALGEPPIERCLAPVELTPRQPDRWRQPDGARRPSIILFAVESLRPDAIGRMHQGQEVMPVLGDLVQRGLVFTRAWAQSTHSDYSDVCIVSSLYPLRRRRHHFYRQDDPWPKTLVYDLLRPAGWATALISSQNEGWGGMDLFLETPGLDLFYDSQRSGAPTQTAAQDTGMAQAVGWGRLVAGKLPDQHTMGVAVGWIREQAGKGRPFFLSLNLQASHFPYLLPPGTAQPFQPCAIDFDASFAWYPPEKTEVVRNAYYNGLREIDRQLGRLVAALQECGRLDDTMLVVYGENGESFHENGLVTHAQEPFESAARVGCVLHAPALVPPGREDYPLELVDLVPTLFGRMGWPTHPQFQGIDVLAPDRPPLDQRLVFVHTENPLTRTDAVILAGRWKLMLDRMAGRSALFDLAEDPGELHDLSVAQPELAVRLRETLLLWRSRQLAYYRYPEYFLSFHPPRPPRWKR